MDDEEGLPDGRKLRREAPYRRPARGPEACLVRQHATAEFHEEHDGPAHTWLPLNSFLNIGTEILMP